MSKRKLSKQQQKRISERHADIVNNLSEAELANAIAAGQLSQELIGTVIANYGKFADVEHSDQQIYRCGVRQNLAAFAVGDEVVWRKAPDDTGVIVAIHPRHGLVWRQQGKQKKLLAANIDQFNIVCAPIPKTNLLLLDSYLVAAHYFHLNSIILLHKCDLLNADAKLATQLDYYQVMNVPMLQTSIYDIGSIKQLCLQLQGKNSIFVGQSGVGKSSLLNQLVSGANARIADSTHLHGKHTTSTANLYHLDQTGCVIDSPGMRDFQLDFLTRTEIAAGFVDFKAYLEKCQFRNCSHQHEPRCGVIDAVKHNHIAHWRYENYLALIKEK
ncbi:MAG: ribosome small subunit-dependent GTPase A [Pseudomonadota bacterium]